MRGISWLTANQLAAQEGLCTVEWVSERVRVWVRVSEWESEWVSIYICSPNQYEHLHYDTSETKRNIKIVQINSLKNYEKKNTNTTHSVWNNSCHYLMEISILYPTTVCLVSHRYFAARVRVWNEWDVIISLLIFLFCPISSTLKW